MQQKLSNFFQLELILLELLVLTLITKQPFISIMCILFHMVLEDIGIKQCVVSGFLNIVVLNYPNLK